MISFLTWTFDHSDCRLKCQHRRGSRRYTTSTWDQKRPWQHITAILKLWNGWPSVVVGKSLLVSLVRNRHDMSILDTSIGPKNYGRRYDTGKTHCISDLSFQGRALELCSRRLRRKTRKHLWSWAVWDALLQYQLCMLRFPFRFVLNWQVERLKFTLTAKTSGHLLVRALRSMEESCDIFQFRLWIQVRLI